MSGLYKTTIVIWSNFDPAETDIEDLSREAMRGDCYCSGQKVEFIDDPPEDPDWDGTEFFTNEEGEEE